jgi:hypothetical protein
LQKNIDQGIHVYPSPFAAGDRIQVNYNGLLSKSGAEEVYLHAGFGLNNQWDDVYDIKMKKTEDHWQTALDVKTNKRLYFCFHDNAENWDNNNGLNWSFEAHNGDLY